MSLPDAALGLLTAWLPANDVVERPQIQVATVDASGRPDVRTVLLSEWDERGFVFHTDSASRKVAQLAANPAVAIDVLWPGFSRQLVVLGDASVLDQEDLERAYARRSPYLRQLAWQNTTELARLGRDERVATWRRFAAEHDVDSLDASPTWTGYRVVADRLTFWQSDADGPSHRIEYRLAADGAWQEHHLAG